MKTKNLAAMAAATLLLAGCAQESVVDVPGISNSKGEKAMSFSAAMPNMTRATQQLQNAGVSEFGVYAQKAVDATKNDYQQVMENYLVKYVTEAPGQGTTWGDKTSSVNGLSYWAYEGLNTADGAQKEQFLKYWDYSTPETEFFGFVVKGGYNNAAANEVVYDGEEHTLTIPRVWASFTNTVKLGEDTYPALAPGQTGSYMLAYQKVEKNGTGDVKYGNDVPFTFRRINGEVRVAFYEKVNGYSVKINKVRVQAMDETITGEGVDKKYTHENGKIVVGCSATVDTDNEITSTPILKKYVEAEYTAPADAAIGTTRATASPSKDIYYTVPCGTEAVGGGNSGFLMTLDFTLSSEDTNEQIVVKGATVYVAPKYTQWAANTKYTYIFKITKYTNGNTDPNDPDNPGLKPIVFDGIQVEEITPAEETSSNTWVVGEPSDNNPIVTIASSLPKQFVVDEETYFPVYLETDYEALNVYCKIDIAETAKSKLTVKYKETNPAKLTTPEEQAQGYAWEVLTMDADGSYYFMKDKTPFPVSDQPLELSVVATEACVINPTITVYNADGTQIIATKSFNCEAVNQK